MPAYVTLGTNQLDKARAFYDALMAEIGWQPLFDHGSGGRVYGDGKTMFGIVGPFNQQPATAGNGTMVGFALATPQAVDLGRLAAAHGVAHELLADWAALEARVAAPVPGVRVLELTTDRKRDAAQRKRWFAELASGLGPS